MAYKTAKKALPESKPQPREIVTADQYKQAIDALKDWWDKHGVQITKIEAIYVASTGGTRWTATVEVRMQHPRLKPAGCALVVVGLYFPGVYDPRPWEIRPAAVPTYEISWWTNDPE